MATPPISIKLRCSSWKQLAAIYERDLKRGSIFLKSAAPPPLGTKVRINLTLPTQTLIVLTGTIAEHVGPGGLQGRGPGVDIKLHSVPDSAMWLMETAIDSARRNGSLSDSPVEKAATTPASSEATMESGDQLVEAEEDLVAALSQELASLRKLNPFQILGVGYETSDEEVRAAFGALTKRYHPDRFARYESSEARRVAAEIFILIRNAYQRLENPASRARIADALRKRRAAKAAELLTTAASRTQARAPGAPDSAAPLPENDFSDLSEPHDAVPVVASSPSTGPTGRMAVPEPAVPAVPAGSAEPSAAVSKPASTADKSGPAPLPAPPKPLADTSGMADDDIAAGDEVAQAQALLDQGQYKEAIRIFRLASRRNPKDLAARVGVEMAEGLKALLQDRDRLEAAQRFEAVLELDPENERAARELAEMRRKATDQRRGFLERLQEQKD